MPKVRKRKTPIVRPLSSNSSSSAPQATRTLIRQFHILLKERSKLQNIQAGDVGLKMKALADIDHQITALGGLESYQRMSVAGQGSDRGGGSEKVLITWFKELNLPQATSQKRRLLEVGALKPDNYQSCFSWVISTPIDLHSRHPSILQQDFLLMDENEHREKWDIISLSLVLNFVPNPQDRGRMLQLAYNMLTPDGYLFLALPLPCVANSRYTTFSHLKSMMDAIGFMELREKWKEGGKMAYWLYRKDSGKATPDALDIFRKKTILRTGHRNNFSILLGG